VARGARTRNAPARRGASGACARRPVGRRPSPGIFAAARGDTR
jgi:hypothetical protein